LYENLGDMQALAGNYPLAEAYFEKALVQPFPQPRIRRAQVYRKISSTLVQQFKHPQAQTALDQAEEALDLVHAPGPLLERQEWIQIHLVRSDVYYWGNHPDQMDATLEKIRAMAETDGRSDQRIEILSQQYMARMRHERYRPTAETIQLARRRLELTAALDNLYDTAWAQFLLGFGLLWYGKPEAGREWIAQAHDAAVKMGARLLQVRSLAYLSVISRKTEDRDALMEQTDQLLELAAAIGETTYEGIALANQGWMAWRDGDFTRAKQCCTSANEVWAKTEGNMFQWLANWVLLAIAVSRVDLGDAEKHAQTLLDPSSIYQPVEEPCAKALHAALCACQAQDACAALGLYTQALDLAKSFHDL
jgi:tetratricopeptide (TPR) repeat protein